jgi:cytochrome oxidase Cu insertion factor (SCO1/SenC/PrrC family)
VNRNRRSNAVILTALLLAWGAAASAEDSPGLDVGAAAPKFELEDQRGRERTLEGLLGGGKLAVVFFRSADW